VYKRQRGLGDVYKRQRQTGFVSLARVSINRFLSLPPRPLDR
jgi:hypothetical protein